ncbi:DNA-3-methyladenine glycosylase I [Maridesulfovibrio sp.]|uniref:DNA-3-methyladenine glycosylase I n=1 Tax=Maridesulfovibrio sp. TaxID=2795000 RepID=UPI0029F50A55|nr:DNA-3-methyladenine glycosylase I [Maridesulfovibrio sp.]
MNQSRCEWAQHELEINYHDTEWGVPLHDDQRHFEFIILEGAQAGLSWLTVLKKRESYRLAFANFDPARVARFDENKIELLRQNEGIIRNKLKINSAVRNARAFLEIQEKFGSFDNYIWQFTNGKTIQNNWKSLSEVPAKTPEAEAMSKDLKKKGFNFVGPTICYAYMQATGMVNDHLVSCFRHQELLEAEKG